MDRALSTPKKKLTAWLEFHFCGGTRRGLALGGNDFGMLSQDPLHFLDHTGVVQTKVVPANYRFGVRSLDMRALVGNQSISSTWGWRIAQVCNDRMRANGEIDSLIVNRPQKWMSESKLGDACRLLRENFSERIQDRFGPGESHGAVETFESGRRFVLQGFGHSLGRPDFLYGVWR